MKKHLEATAEWHLPTIHLEEGRQAGRKAQSSAESLAKPAAPINPILGHPELQEPTGTGPSGH